MVKYQALRYSCVFINVLRNVFDFFKVELGAHHVNFVIQSRYQKYFGL